MKNDSETSHRINLKYRICNSNTLYKCQNSSIIDRVPRAQRRKKYLKTVTIEAGRRKVYILRYDRDTLKTHHITLSYR